MRLMKVHLLAAVAVGALMLAARGQATQMDDPSGTYWLLDAATHSSLLESLAERGLPLRASRAAAA